MQDHGSSMWDWFMDHVAMLVLALAVVAVLSVTVGSGLVMFGTSGWALASEVAAIIAVFSGTIVGIVWLVLCIRDACKKD